MNNLALKTHWVFDLDGTLTERTLDFGSIREELQVPYGTDILAHIAQLPVHRARILRNRLDRMERAAARHCQPAPGMLILLQRLRLLKRRCAIVTRNSRRSAHIALRNLGIYDIFDQLISREDSAPKPAPDSLLILRDLWQTTADTMVMVGDYRYDLEAGRRAGMTTIHVCHGGDESWPELSDFIVEDLAELASLLD